MDYGKINKDIPSITEPLQTAVPVAIRGWILLDNDISHIRTVLARCDEFNINHLQISHGQLVHSISDMIKDRWRIKRVNLITELAHQKNIETFVWTHELDNIPDEFRTKNGKIDIDNRELWNFLEKRYMKGFEVADFDGLVLTLMEAGVTVYNDDYVVSVKPPEERISYLINFLYRLCHANGRKLIVRTFSNTSQIMNWILKGLENTPEDIVVMCKCHPKDWCPYLPHNHLIDYYFKKGRSVIVEFDLGEEYHGQGAFPYFQVEYLRYRLNYILNRSCQLSQHKQWGCAARIERYFGHALGGFNEVNLKVFSAILSKPNVDEHKVLDEWLQERFDRWADKVKQIIRQTYPMINNIVNPIPGITGVLMHNAVADYLYIYHSLAIHPGLRDFIEGEQAKNAPDRIIAGDEETCRRVFISVAEAEEILEEILKLNAELSQQMPIELYWKLAIDIRLLEAFVRINAAHHRVFLAIQLWNRKGDDSSKKEAKKYLNEFKEQVKRHSCALSFVPTDGIYLNRRGIEMFINQCERILEIGVSSFLEEEKDNIESFPERYKMSRFAPPG